LGSEPLEAPTVTDTSELPAPAREGVTALIDVGDITLTLVADAPPIDTTAPSAKPLPVMVTAVPPPVPPRDGATAMTVTRAGLGVVGDEQPASAPATHSTSPTARRPRRPPASTDENIRTAIIAESSQRNVNARRIAGCTVQAKELG
jgi:hypothetical protein